MNSGERHDVSSETPPPLHAASPTALPENEPSALPVLRGRDDVLAQIDELEGTLQYVGSLHPRRDEMRQRLEGLKTLLEHWDHTVALQKARDATR